ncbi:GCK [Cordylochernes scorpioides]|uniref:hexokinase n=1 Tax=Cordylochernes scorpioides TaxID=51811 RepID=A0ABY6L418_9ARAC|nr:GCK [Cordylochernes scorpioides]
MDSLIPLDPVWISWNKVRPRLTRAISPKPWSLGGRFSVCQSWCYGFVTDPMPLVAATNMIELQTRALVLTNEQLEKVTALLLHQFHLGLSRDTHEKASVKMFPTFVRDVPNGTEQGKYLALDLGGTNFRVLLVELDGDRCEMRNETYAVSHRLMVGPGKQLFDHIADCLAAFVEAQGLQGERLPLGFTFSFPLLQESLSSARLVNWTKGFKCPGVEEEDVVRLLREAIARRGDLNIDIVAIINDTTGTLMSCAHKNRQCRIGIIVGTGTNACYMETVYVDNANVMQGAYLDCTDNANLWDRDIYRPEQVIVNTEWGAFGDDGSLDFIRTPFDHEVDSISLNKGRQLFEKMISGMYMGEVARTILASLTRQGLLFGGKGSTQLFTPYAFHTKYISMIESDPKRRVDATQQVLEELGIPNASVDDCLNVKLVCSRVSTRAAYLVSTAIATIINKMKRPHTTVGIDGSVYKFHPHFHDLMEKKIEELTDPNYGLVNIYSYRCVLPSTMLYITARLCIYIMLESPEHLLLTCPLTNQIVCRYFETLPNSLCVYTLSYENFVKFRTICTIIYKTLLIHRTLLEFFYTLPCSLNGRVVPKVKIFVKISEITEASLIVSRPTSSFLLNFSPKRSSRYADGFHLALQTTCYVNKLFFQKNENGCDIVIEKKS